MGLVDDEQVLVLEHDADLEGDPLLGRDRTMEEVEPAWDDRIIPGHSAARLVAHIAFGQQAAARGRTRLGEFGFEALTYRVGNGQVVLLLGGLPPGARSAVAEIPSRGGSGLRGMPSVYDHETGRILRTAERTCQQPRHPRGRDDSSTGQPLCWRPWTTPNQRRHFSVRR